MLAAPHPEEGRQITFTLLRMSDFMTMKSPSAPPIVFDRMYHIDRMNHGGRSRDTITLHSSIRITPRSLLSRESGIRDLRHGGQRMAKAVESTTAQEPEKKRVNGRRRLTKADVDRVVDLVRQWPEMPMTWELIVAAVARDVRMIDNGKKVGMQTWSRQALSNHAAIKKAYQARRAELNEEKAAPKARRSRDPEIIVLRKEVEALRLENTVLRETIAEYENRFATMVHNRALGAQTEQELLKPLKPKLDRQGRDQ